MLLICTVHICKIYVNNNFFRKRSLQIIWKTCKWKILLILIPCKKRNNTHSQSTQYKIWRKMHWFKVAMFFCYCKWQLLQKVFSCKQLAKYARYKFGRWIEIASFKPLLSVCYNSVQFISCKLYITLFAYFANNLIKLMSIALPCSLCS